MIIDGHLGPLGTFETITYSNPQLGAFTLCMRYRDDTITETYPNTDWDDVLKYALPIIGMRLDEFSIPADGIKVVVRALKREIDLNLGYFQQVMGR